MKGHFKTAYLQREIPLDVLVIAPDSGKIEVGDIVTLADGKFKDADGNYKDCKIVTKKAYSNAASLVPAAGDYIVAQSDMTLKSGAVGISGSDIYAYYYHDEVEGIVNAVSASGSLSGTTPPDFYEGANGYYYELTSSGASSGDYDVVVPSTNANETEYYKYAAGKDAVDKTRGSKRGAFYKVTNVEDVWYTQD